MDKLGIVAGNGALPACLVRACQKQGRPFCVLALKGHADLSQFPNDIDIVQVRLGALGRAVCEMKKRSVRDIVFIGGVRRPSLIELCPDLKALSVFLKAGLRCLGDDGLLRTVIHQVEKYGFRVIGVDELIPQLLAPLGVLGTVLPSVSDLKDIRRGFQAAKILGQADVGQSVIVQQGLVLAVEAIEGTAALIARSTELRRKGSGGVLVKVSKPQQERRIDLPTIGPDTIQGAIKAGLKGIAVESDSVLIVDIDQTIQKANKAGIFVIGVDEKCLT